MLVIILNIIIIQFTTGNYRSEVYAVRLEKNYKVVKLGCIDSTFNDCTSCCVYQGTLYSTGVGDNQDQVWSFNLDNRESSQCSRYVYIYAKC